MSNYKKALKIFFALIIVFGLSFISVIFGGSQKAQVSSSVSDIFYSPFNENGIVLAAQEKLKSFGMYRGRISGLFGFKTRNAILVFQERENLKLTGILDIPTQEALFVMEYTEVPSTEKGQNFLYEWGYVDYGRIIGEETKIEGKVSPVKDSVFYGEPVKKINFILNSGSKRYAIKNISQNDFNKYRDENVKIKGYLLPEYTNTGEQVFVFNFKHLVRLSTHTLSTSTPRRLIMFCLLFSYFCFCD